jgi:hypothetical protein
MLIVMKPEVTEIKSFTLNKTVPLYDYSNSCGANNCPWTHLHSYSIYTMKSIYILCCILIIFILIAMAITFLFMDSLKNELGIYFDDQKFVEAKGMSLKSFYKSVSFIRMFFDDFFFHRFLFFSSKFNSKRK